MSKIIIHNFYMSVPENGMFITSPRVTENTYLGKPQAEKPQPNAFISISITPEKQEVIDWGMHIDGFVIQPTWMKKEMLESEKNRALRQRGIAIIETVNTTA